MGNSLRFRFGLTSDALKIATHGRTDKKERMEFFAHDLLGETSRLAQASGQSGKKRDLIVVTLVRLLAAR